MLLRKEKLVLPLVASLSVLAWTDSASAGVKLKVGKDSFLKVGAGIRVGFQTKRAAEGPDKQTKVSFSRQNTRLYLVGQVTRQFAFTFNTEVMSGKFDVMDAVARYEPHPAFNVWLGRMLTPSNRIALNGPYYGLSWNQYTLPMYPSLASDSHDVAGLLDRDEGITVWGRLGQFRYAVGVYDGYGGADGRNQAPLVAGRFSYDFLNKEGAPAYYTSSAYHGKQKDLLTLAVAAQAQPRGLAYVNVLGVNQAANFVGVSADLLFEKVLRQNHVLTVEGEFKFLDCGCNTTQIRQPIFMTFDGTSAFGTAGFMFGQKVGPGQFQPYARFNANMPQRGQKSYLGELGLNYVIDGHNMRVNLNATHGNANSSGYKGIKNTAVSLGVQVQI